MPPDSLLVLSRLTLDADGLNRTAPLGIIESKARSDVCRLTPIDCICYQVYPTLLRLASFSRFRDEKGLAVGVELRPLGVLCNIQCQYCYQNPQRDAGNVLPAYDISEMKAAIIAEGGPFSLFGGEPLLVPERDLEVLWAWGLKEFGRNDIQTNGTLINEHHMRLFKQYRVQVGISVDGPGELNDVRWAGTQERTREATAKTLAAISLLCQEGIAPSLIITLHRGNATGEQLSRLQEWLFQMEAMGVSSARLHLLEVESESIRQKYALSTEENLEALLSFARIEARLTTLRLDLFEDMQNLLLGNDNISTCVWNACDTYTTRAVSGIEGNGQRSNCGRTNKDGIDFVKANSEGFERYLALYQTPQEYGGCESCRFFIMCKGQCPGTAIERDWRNRTEHCDVWKGLFRYLEQKLIEEGDMPLSLSPIRREIEGVMIETWAAGRNSTIAQALEHISRAHDESWMESGREHLVRDSDLQSNV
jgi:uncharacterized protein